MTDTRVERNDDRNRYEIYVSDAGDSDADFTLAGFTEFTHQQGKVRFVHTEVDRAFLGRGLADILASEALADVARRGDTIVPLCPFIAKYLTENEVAGAVVQWPHGTPSHTATPPEDPA